jgi:hypothetical protein
MEKQEVIQMAFTNEAVTDFMERYFKTFCKCAQDPENMDKMSEYFAPELEFKQYYPNTPHVRGLKNFHKLNDHSDVHETLTPNLIIVDTKRKVVSVMIDVVVKNTRTGKTLLTPTYNAIYHFKHYKDGSFKISKIWLFVEHSAAYEKFLEGLPKG